MSSTPHDANSMDQVRELLFGAQVKEIEEHLRKQEAKIMEQLEALRAEVRANLQSLEAQVSTRIEAEARQRGQEQKNCVMSLEKLKEELENRSASFYAALNKSESGIQELISNENLRITATVEERYKFALDTLSEKTTQIREDMVDRNAVAALLGQLASQIAPGAEPPAKSGKKG